MDDMPSAVIEALAAVIALANKRRLRLSAAEGETFLRNLQHIVETPHEWEKWTSFLEEKESDGGRSALEDDDDKTDPSPREDGVLEEGEARQDQGTPQDVSADLRKPLAPNVETNYTKRKRNAADDSESDGIASQPVEKAPKKRGKPFADGATTSIAQTRDRRTTSTATYKEVSSTGKRSSKPQATSASQTKASARPRFRTAHVDVQAEYGTALPRSSLEAIPQKCIEIAGDFADDAVKIKDFENSCQRLMVESLFGTGSLNLMVNIEKFSHTLISAQDVDTVREIDEYLDEHRDNALPEQVQVFLHWTKMCTVESIQGTWATFRLAFASYSSVIAYDTLRQAYDDADPAVVKWVMEFTLQSGQTHPLTAIVRKLQPAWVRKDLYTARLLTNFLDMCGGPAVMLLFPQDWNPKKVLGNVLGQKHLKALAKGLADELAALMQLVGVLDTHIWQKLMAIKFIPSSKVQFDPVTFSQELTGLGFGTLSSAIQDRNFPGGQQMARIVAADNGGDTDMGEAGHPAQVHAPSPSADALSTVQSADGDEEVAAPMGQLHIGPQSPLGPSHLEMGEWKASPMGQAEFDKTIEDMYPKSDEDREDDLLSLPEVNDAELPDVD